MFCRALPKSSIYYRRAAKPASLIKPTREFTTRYNFKHWPSRMTASNFQKKNFYSKSLHLQPKSPARKKNKVENGWKKEVRPAFGCAQHPKAGRNTTAMVLWFSCGFDDRWVCNYYSLDRIILYSKEEIFSKQKRVFPFKLSKIKEPLRK